jgi:hypothetical protein
VGLPLKPDIIAMKRQGTIGTLMTPTLKGGVNERITVHCLTDFLALVMFPFVAPEEPTSSHANRPAKKLPCLTFVARDSQPV